MPPPPPPIDDPRTAYAFYTFAKGKSFKKMMLQDITNCGILFIFLPNYNVREKLWFYKLYDYLGYNKYL